MRVPEPYFLKNKEWYYFDEEEFMYKLTDKATRKARKSYKDFYKEIESLHYIEENHDIKIKF